MPCRPWRSEHGKDHLLHPSIAATWLSQDTAHFVILPARRTPYLAVSRKVEITVLLVADIAAIVLSALVYMRIQFGDSFGMQGFQTPNTELIYPVYAAVGLAVFWVLVFLFFGMYRERYASSRFDELVSLTKVVTFGVLILVFIIFIDSLGAEGKASIIFLYWGLVLGMTSVGRIAVRSLQKALILRGYGTHKALVVGWSDEVERIYEELAHYPAAGLQIVGAIRLGQKTGEMPPERVSNGEHQVEALSAMIDELEVQDVLVALGSDDHAELNEVLRLCDGKSVSLKIVPDFYTVIGGMARTEHIYGLPLIEVLPIPMPAWEQSTKRMMDIAVSLIVLVAFFPVWMLIALFIRLSSAGGAIYRQRRVGRLGRHFTIYKFRTMHQNAEEHTGPVWATKDDPRYISAGRWLRKTRLDEIPQLFNVLKGDMSLVGPRPERPYFVKQLTYEIPLYNRRHRVKPGITGWAQVMWGYDSTLEDVRQKVKFDLFYIENMGLRMDFKILLRTVTAVLTGRGR